MTNGALAAPQSVGRIDKMAIKSPKEINNIENKCFHAEVNVDFNPISNEFNSLTNEIRTEKYYNCVFDESNDSFYEGTAENKIINPTEKSPVSIAEFMGKYLNLEPIRNIFLLSYGRLDYHYRFPLDAMIKSSMIRRIKSMRSFQKLVNRFETRQEDAKFIGFENNGNDRCKIPDRRTFRHWENVRVDNNILEIAMDASVSSLNHELNKKGIVLGKNIGIDSTPLESLFNDKDAKYSGHYEKTGYKIHGAYDLDRNIPLAIIITPMNEGDSPYFKPLLDKLHSLGIRFEKVFADGAYNSYENFALIHAIYKARFYTNLGVKATYNDKGTIEGIQHEYNKLRYKPDFIPPDQITLVEKMQYLMKYGKTEVVGAYFRNQLLKTWTVWKRKQKKQDHILYNDRNVAEGYHGFVKKYLNLQNYFDYRGIKNVERHVRWTYLAILGIALTRAQNGITENLTQIAYFE